MRLSVILLLICAHVGATGLSQKVTLKATKVPIAQVFNSIKQQTGYSFFWDQQLLDKAPLITVTMQDASIEQALNNCLRGLNLSYEIKGKIILISEKKAAAKTLATTMSEAVAPPTRTLYGKVVDENGKPLANANVVLLALNFQTVTNDKGEFSFKDVPEGVHSLRVTYVGYIQDTKYFTLTASTPSFTIKMMPELTQQEDVVISTGYQKLTKQSATGSYSVVTSKQIEQTPSVNIMERLEGKVPGVMIDVRRNKIEVRGVASFGPGNNVKPLIVIDGFPYIDQQFTNIAGSNLTPGGTSGSVNPLNPPVIGYSGNSILSSFNPSDIESISFLKDAAATSIWGAYAANGVIVIETKKGRKNTAATVNLTTTLSTSAPANLSKLNTMTSAEYIDLEKELFNKNFYTDPTSHYRNSEVSEAVNWMYMGKRGVATASQVDSALNALSGRSNFDQIRDNLLQRITSQQYNLSVSGGGENGTYHVSGNYRRNQPVYKSNRAENYFLTSNTSNEFLNKRITLNAGLNYTYSKSIINTAALQGLGVGQYGLSPYDMLLDANGNAIQRGTTFTKRVSDSLTALGHLPWTYSPVDELNYNNTILVKSAVRLNVSLTGKITDWLNVQVSGQLQRNNEQQDNLQDLNSIYTRILVNTGTVITNGKPVNNFPKGGIYKMSTVNSEDYSGRVQFNARKEWSGGHQFSMLAGAELRQTKGTGFKQTRYGYDPILNTSVVVNPTANYMTMYGYNLTIGYMDGNINRSRLRYLSYLSSANYSYRNKYFVSASARFDDHSMVGVRRSQRGTPLWSAGFRWNALQEKFMPKSNLLSSLFFRTSYGTAGSLGNNASAFTVIGFGSTEATTGLPYATIYSPGNPELTWAVTKTFNVAVDAGLFNNRLNATVELYNKRSNNIFVNVPVNSTFGFSTLQYNTSSMFNHGVEVNLSGIIINKKNWKWESNLNFSYNTNKVTDNRFQTNTTASAAINRVTEGYPTDNLFVFRWAGLNAQGQPQIYNSKGDVVQSANFPTVYANDQVYVGRTTAPYFGGFNNTLYYKNWSLSARATYYLGHKFLINEITSGHYPTSTQMSGRLGTSRAFARRWRNPGDEAFTNVPGISDANNNTVDWYNNSDIGVRDAGHIRLQQLTLGYSFAQSLLNKIGVFKSAGINATASNLGILWRKNKDGVDPDYIMTDDYNNLPPAVNYTIAVNLIF